MISNETRKRKYGNCILVASGVLAGILVLSLITGAQTFSRVLQIGIGIAVLIVFDILVWLTFEKASEIRCDSSPQTAAVEKEFRAPERESWTTADLISDIKSGIIELRQTCDDLEAERDLYRSKLERIRRVLFSEEEEEQESQPTTSFQRVQLETSSMELVERATEVEEVEEIEDPSNMALSPVKSRSEQKTLSSQQTMKSFSASRTVEDMS
jgi:hypothetical protein